MKNTLTKIAAQEAGVAAFDDLLQGPSAIAFVKGDPVEAAKGLRDFAKAHPLLVIKGGVLDGKALSPDEIRKLADLESREVLLAKLAGAMKASLQNAVYLFAAPLAQAARVMDALRPRPRPIRACCAEEPVRRRPRLRLSPRQRPSPRQRRAEAAADATRSRARLRADGPAPTSRTDAASAEAPPTDQHRRPAPDQHRPGLTARPTCPAPAYRTEGPPPWRSSAPTTCSTRSRR